MPAGNPQAYQDPRVIAQMLGGMSGNAAGALGGRNQAINQQVQSAVSGSQPQNIPFGENELSLTPDQIQILQRFKEIIESGQEPNPELMQEVQSIITNSGGLP